MQNPAKIYPLKVSRADRLIVCLRVLIAILWVVLVCLQPSWLMRGLAIVLGVFYCYELWRAIHRMMHARLEMNESGLKVVSVSGVTRVGRAQWGLIKVERGCLEIPTGFSSMKLRRSQLGDQAWGDLIEAVST